MSRMHRRRRQWIGPLCILATLAPFARGQRAFAQRAPDDTTKTFFVKRDLVWSAAALAGTAIISVFDKRIAHWTQTPAVQGSSSRHRFVNDLTKVNETTLTGAAILSYGIGRLIHDSTVADVSLHTAESTILTSAISQAIRGPVGRERRASVRTTNTSFSSGEASRTSTTDRSHRCTPRSVSPAQRPCRRKSTSGIRTPARGSHRSPTRSQ